MLEGAENSLTVLVEIRRQAAQKFYCFKRNSRIGRAFIKYITSRFDKFKVTGRMIIVLAMRTIQDNDEQVLHHAEILLFQKKLQDRLSIRLIHHF